MTTFAELGLAEPLLAALDGEGYTQPTPIQTQAIPSVMAGRDLLGIAQTGTGKTAAFALPILHRLAADKKAPPRRGCRALILSPTRELASQIADSFRTYGRNMGVSVAVVFGGVAHKPQILATRNGVDVLVATPGRLLDHMDERNIEIEGTEILVLDEADQMLDLGFVKPIRRIVSRLAMKRQSLFFSATMPHEIGALAAELLRDPQKVSVAPAATTAERVSQRVIHVEAPKKKALLVELLADAAMARTLVFTRTKRGADRVARHLEAAGISCAAIHGNKSQAQRERALGDFRAAKTRVLVATDIAARGIDIDLVSHVVNYELPEVPEAYVHRIGRTARAGAEGQAISFCDQEERSQLREIERVTRQKIDAEDRRNDATLAADKRPAPRAETEGEAQENGRAPYQHRRGAPHQRGGRDGDRRDAGSGERAHGRNERRDNRPGRHAEHRSEPRGGAARHGARPNGGSEARPDRNGPHRQRRNEAGAGLDRNGPRTEAAGIVVHRDPMQSPRPDRSWHPSDNSAGELHEPRRHNGQRPQGAKRGEGPQGAKRGERPQGQRHGDRPARSQHGERDGRGNGFETRPAFLERGPREAGGMAPRSRHPGDRGPHGESRSAHEGTHRTSNRHRDTEGRDVNGRGHGHGHGHGARSTGGKSGTGPRPHQARGTRPSGGHPRGD